MAFKFCNDILLNIENMRLNSNLIKWKMTSPFLLQGSLGDHNVVLLSIVGLRNGGLVHTDLHGQSPWFQH